MLLTETRQKNEKIEKESTKANKLANDFLEKVKRYNAELARKEQVENEIKALQARAVQAAQDILNLPVKGEKVAGNTVIAKSKVKTKTPVVPEPLVIRPKSTAGKDALIVSSHVYIAPEIILDKDEPTPVPEESLITPEVATVSSSAVVEPLTGVVFAPKPVSLPDSAEIVVKNVKTTDKPPAAEVVAPDSPVVEEVSEAPTETREASESKAEAPVIEEEPQNLIVNEAGVLAKAPEVVQDVAKPAESVVKRKTADMKVEVLKPVSSKLASGKNTRPFAPLAPIKPEGPLKFVNNTEKIDKTLDKMVADLSQNDQKVIETEMKKTELLSIEAPEAKKDKKVFLRNSIVKMFSGMKISESVRKIILRGGVGLLAGIGVLAFVSSDKKASYKPEPEAADAVRLITQNALKKEVGGEKVYQYQAPSFQEVRSLDSILNAPPQIDSETYNMLSPEAQQDYMDGINNKVDTFYIVDKPVATFYAIGPGGKAYGSCPVLLGQTVGETPNTVGSAGPKGSDATTPMGKYFIGYGFNEYDRNLYQGKIYKIFNTNALAIHKTYPGELVPRTKSLKTKTVADNRMSWGCINMDERDFDRLISRVPAKTMMNGKEHLGALLYITPDHPEKYVYNPTTHSFEEKKGGEQIARNAPNGGNYFGPSTSTGGPG